MFMAEKKYKSTSKIIVFWTRHGKARETIPCQIHEMGWAKRTCPMMYCLPTGPIAILRGDISVMPAYIHMNKAKHIDSHPYSQNPKQLHSRLIRQFCWNLSNKPTLTLLLSFMNMGIKQQRIEMNSNKIYCAVFITIIPAQSYRYSSSTQ